MKVHAEAKPLHQPLGGGNQGATVTVEPIIAGRVSWPALMLEAPRSRFLQLKLLRALFSRKGRWDLPCPAFLVRHPSAGNVLVDTGLHPSVATDPRQNFGSLAVRVAPPALGPGEDVPAQLRARGVHPRDVHTVVMTHLHFDHASGISEFPDAVFVIAEQEWLAATTGRAPALNGYRHAHYDFVFDYRTLDYDRAGIDSYASFGRTFDLFGDGSVRLAYTPGHSAGHQSVICRLRERDFLIAGDAIYTQRQLDAGPLPPRPYDAHRFRRSLQELKLFKRQYPEAVICPGHDPAFYAELGERYE
jgi:N-acyl homoserine lactone hydrolase